MSSSRSWAVAAAWTLCGAVGWFLGREWLFGLMAGFGGLALGWRRRTLSPFFIAGAGIGAGAALYRGAWSLLAGGLGGMVLGAALMQWRRPAARSGRTPSHGGHVLVCHGQVCRRAGAPWLYQVCRSRAASSSVHVVRTRCFGCCSEAPAIWLEPQGVIHTGVKLVDLPHLFLDNGGSDAH